MPKYIKNYVNQKRTFEVDSEDEVATLPTHAKNNLGYHYIKVKQEAWLAGGGSVRLTMAARIISFIVRLIRLGVQAP